MQIERLILCIIAPPLAVIDRGTNEVILVAFFTVLGWVPGVMVAVGINVAAWAATRRQAEHSTTIDAMQASVQRQERLVNLPKGHHSGESRYQLALRAQAMQERQEQKKKANHI